MVVHPLTPADAKARASLRPLLAPHKGDFRGVAAARAAFDVVMRQTPAAENVEYAPDTIGGVSGIWCRPAGATNRNVLYLHGGWFVSGSADAYSNFVGQIAGRAGSDIFVPDYRLAPEHPFPAATEDVRAVYEGLVGRGVRDPIIAGDSAGGALALELLVSVVRRELAQPKGAEVLSPVTDLSLSGASWESRDAADVLFTKAQARELVALYLAGADPGLPFSALTQDFTGFPPLRVYVGDDEVLLDDSVRLAQRAEAARVDVRLDVWEGMLHVFPASVPMFEAANDALDQIAAFIRA